jgi:hypothetical protein
MNQLEKRLPERFTNAVTKLYDAFHSGKLNAMNCKKCAVGNILDNYAGWDMFRDELGQLNETPLIYSFEEQKKALEVIYSYGYSLKEIIKVEEVFLNAMRIKDLQKPKKYKKKDKERNYKGLCAVVEYLCELDNIPNILDYSSLFEFDDNNKPKKELNFIKQE